MLVTSKMTFTSTNALYHKNALLVSHELFCKLLVLNVNACILCLFDFFVCRWNGQELCCSFHMFSTFSSHWRLPAKSSK